MLSRYLGTGTIGTYSIAVKGQFDIKKTRGQESRVTIPLSDIPVHGCFYVQDTEVLMLATNMIRKDLISTSQVPTYATSSYGTKSNDSDQYGTYGACCACILCICLSLVRNSDLHFNK